MWFVVHCQACHSKHRLNTKQKVLQDMWVAVVVSVAVQFQA